MKGFIFFTHVCDCSVKTELIGKNNYAKKSLNRCLVGTKVNRQFSVSFALELTPGQWKCWTENWTPAFSELQQHLVRDVITNSLWTILFHRRPLLLGTWTNEWPLSYTKLLCKYGENLWFSKHSSSLPLLSQEMSLNIDIIKMLPVKVSGVSPNLLSRSVTSMKNCNVVNPWKYSTRIQSALH